MSAHAKRVLREVEDVLFVVPQLLLERFKAGRRFRLGKPLLFCIIPAQRSRRCCYRPMRAAGAGGYGMAASAVLTNGPSPTQQRRSARLTLAEAEWCLELGLAAAHARAERHGIEKDAGALRGELRHLQLERVALLREHLCQSRCRCG